METRSNKLLVAGSVAILLAALIGYILWVTPDSGRLSRRYDLLFEKSVAGLRESSIVTFAGISIGRVEKIRFDAEDPGVVRVRIIVNNPDAPILKGTIASISRNMFGEALIRLDGAKSGAPPIVALHHGKIPVIPVKKGVGMFDDPATMVEAISRTTDRLNAALSPSGQKTISDRIGEIERKSAVLADNAPALAAKLASARAILQQGGSAATAAGEKAEAIDRKLQKDGPAKMAALRASLRSTQAGLEQLDTRLEIMRPKLQAVSQPQLREQVADLQASASTLRESVERVDRSGAGGLISKPKLPDHESRQ